MIILVKCTQNKNKVNIRNHIHKIFLFKTHGIQGHIKISILLSIGRYLHQWNGWERRRNVTK